MSTSGTAIAFTTTADSQIAPGDVSGTLKYTLEKMSGPATDAKLIADADSPRN